MQTLKFKDISIVSAKKPISSNLWWETVAGGLYLVDSGNDKHIFYSSDKADNWSQIDIDPSDSSGDNVSRDHTIRSGWHDRPNKIIYFVDCDNDGTADDFDVWKLDYSASESSPTVTEIGTSPAPNQANSVYVHDIFMIGVNVYVMNREDDIGGGGGDNDLVVWDVDTAPFTEQDRLDAGDWTFQSSYLGVVNGNLYYNVLASTTGSFLMGITYNHGTTTIAFGGSSTQQINTVIPSLSQNGVSFDGVDNLNFVGDVTGTATLITWAITADTFTEITTNDLALMLDRNNTGTVPNEFEKGFSIGASETVYEIKARRGGVRILQDMKEITDAVIIAITDNFLMNDGGDMFEFTDVTNEISTIRYNDGIIGIQKKGVFTVHPDFHINWSKKDSIKIYDDNDVLEFHGIITDKNRNKRGIYVFKIDSFTNEIYRATYEKSYSGDDTDTKQKDIIDNGCDFCYRSSSIVGTTTNYDYAYNRAIVYLFWLTRFLERQVPYIEPDGKIWTKAHDGLAKNDMIYGATYNFKNDDIGGNPAGWTLDEVGGTVNVISDLDGHKKVVELHFDTGDVSMLNTFSAAQPNETIEFWGAVNNIGAVSSYVIIFEGATTIVQLRFVNGDLYTHSGGGYVLVKADFMTVNVLDRIKIVCNDAANTHDIYVNGVLEADDLAYRNNSTIGVEKVQFYVGNAMKFYIDAVGFSHDPKYNVGDNEVAWDLANHWQEVFLIDIPGIEERIQGFFDGNSGVTRNTIRYKNNALTIRPVAATRDPIEQLQGILPLNEFRDPKLEAATEANQLGDNRYNIWSSDIIFLGLRIEGQGYLQPGKTIEIRNTGEITITKDDFLILSFERDPKNDVYISMILSDNIIFPREFNNLQDTTITQVHTASVQAIENQGGIALRSYIKTGTYTGNGADNRQITGFGFQPSFIIITRLEGGVGFQYVRYATDVEWTSIELADKVLTTDSIKFISDGIEVNNSRGDDSHNRNGITYHYTAWG